MAVTVALEAAAILADPYSLRQVAVCTAPYHCRTLYFWLFCLILAVAVVRSFWIFLVFSVSPLAPRDLQAQRFSPIAHFFTTTKSLFGLSTSQSFLALWSCLDVLSGTGTIRGACRTPLASTAEAFAFHPRQADLDQSSFWLRHLSARQSAPPEPALDRTLLQTSPRCFVALWTAAILAFDLSSAPTPFPRLLLSNQGVFSSLLPLLPLVNLQPLDRIQILLNTPVYWLFTQSLSQLRQLNP